MNLDDKVNFKYGFGLDNKEQDYINMYRRVSTHAEFTVVSLYELVSCLFVIMHKLLDSNEQ